MMEEPSWKKTKLSLERPYKDDTGERIPVLLDIAPDGVQAFEPYVMTPSLLILSLKNHPSQSTRSH
jgi:hypothetical protein